MYRQSNELASFSPRQMRPLRVAQDQALALAQNYQDLNKIGIGIRPQDLEKMAAYDHACAMDAGIVSPLTTASVTTPIQFAQHWLPGFTEIVTAARKIDNLIGMVTQGNWYDEEIVQGVLEHTGDAQLYGDYTQTPYTNWNINYERRSIVRFEEGAQVGTLEEQRAGAIRTSSIANKRAAASMSLEIRRNEVGFFGFNGGNNRTYGFLNDTDLLAYNTVPDGASGSSEWSTKTYLEIVRDLRTAAAGLRTQSDERVDPNGAMVTLAIATNAIDMLTTTSQFGNSVRDWIKENYPNWRIESAPELNDANGGAGVFYLYAESVADSGSDDQRTFIQVIPTKFQTLGVDQRSKSYEESYSNATAGVMVKRPYAIYRGTGIS